MTYSEYKSKKQKEINALPLLYAFSQKRLNEIMEEKGCTKDDFVSVGFGGAFVHKDDVPQILEYLNQENLLPELLKDKDFFTEALMYEACNHEVDYTKDFTDAFDVLDISEEWIKENGLEKEYKAIKKKLGVRY